MKIKTVAVSKIKLVGVGHLGKCLYPEITYSYENFAEALNHFESRNFTAGLALAANTWPNFIFRYKNLPLSAFY
ncbi:hypothetical protein KUTeg_012522 [Tegillarca granosa]|uniref:Uncharacterized protein n=1 Tax=Tegillarca granosa TaxID=220873 RepID=A0ABQ9EZS4_TEGGR|nr:hypothetical protein KUTeg_012522 [Tegillarca granosa]